MCYLKNGDSMPLAFPFFYKIVLASIVSIYSLSGCCSKLPSPQNDICSPQEENSIEKPTTPQITLIKPTKGKRISSMFGMRRHPIRKGTHLHTGIDITGNRGDKVVAAANGTVIFSGRRGSYGLMVDLDIGDGIVLRYAHLDKLQVKKGTYVVQGQCIGKLGRTGRTTAPHLHFEVRVYNTPIDPMPFIEQSHHWAIKPQPAL